LQAKDSSTKIQKSEFQTNQSKTKKTETGKKQVR